MKICINGVTRDMTPEEEARYIAQSEQLSADEALDIILGVSE